MTKITAAPRKWEAKFLAALGKGQCVRQAAKAAGVSASTVYEHRAGNARFADEWEDALDVQQCEAKPEIAASRLSQWRKGFLEALAETSNVSASAASVNVPTRTVYKERREDPDFAGRWLAALSEGYDNLEMELLGYLRDPQPKRKMDVAAALRLLAAHRDTVERRRSLAEDEDEQAVLDSIDRFIDEMRERRAANEAILAETDAGTDTGAEADNGAQ